MFIFPDNWLIQTGFTVETSICTHNMLLIAMTLLSLRRNEIMKTQIKDCLLKHYLNYHDVIKGWRRCMESSLFLCDIRNSHVHQTRHILGHACGSIWLRSSDKTYNQWTIQGHSKLTGWRVFVSRYARPSTQRGWKQMGRAKANEPKPMN